MAYKPLVVSAIAKDTGWPIDGHKIYVAKWSYDPDSWHIYGWEDPEAEAMAKTIWQSLTEAGMQLHDSWEDFKADWDAEKPVTDMVLTFKDEQLEILKVEQEEDPDEEVPGDLPFPDVKVEPRKPTDKGGILLLPMKKNLGDVSESHPDWKLISCPECGAECYEFPEAHRLQLTQGVKLMCTECGIKAGLVKAYSPKNMPHPDGNRAKRRSKNYKALKRMEKAARRKP